MPSVKKNFFYNLLLLLSNLLFPIINFAYASRILGPAGIGKVQFIITFATYFVLIAQLGIPVYGMREVAKAKGDRQKLSRLFSELLVINIVSSILMLLVYLVLILTLPWFRDSLNYYLLASLLVLSGFSVLEWFYQGMEHFRFLTLRSVVIKTLILAGLLLFVRSSDDLMIYFLLTLGATLAINGWNLLGLRKRVRFSIKKMELKKHLSPLIILFLSSLTIGVYTLGDTLLLGFISGDKFVGFYTAAKKIILITIPLINSLGMVLIPRMSESFGIKDTKELHARVSQSFSFICLFGIPVSLGLMIFAPEIMIVFSGSQFSSAGLTLQLIAPTIFLIALGYFFGFQLLIAGGFEKLYLKATISGMIISLILNFILIGSFQDKGAAVTLLLTEGLVSLMAYFFVRKKFTLHLNWTLAFNALLASLLFVPIAMLMRHTSLPLILTLFFGVVVSTVVYFVIQIFVFQEPLMKQLVREVSRKLNM